MPFGDNVGGAVTGLEGPIHFSCLLSWALEVGPHRGGRMGCQQPLCPRSLPMFRTPQGTGADVYRLGCFLLFSSLGSGFLHRQGMWIECRASHGK